MKRKTISMLLVLAMLLSLLSAGVLAAEPEAADSAETPASAETAEDKTDSTKTPEADETEEPESARLTVTKTSKRADSVINYDGYCSILIQQTMSEQNPGEVSTYPKTALIDRNDRTIMPYRESWFRYRVYDGVISLTGESMYEEYALGNISYTPAETAGYYDLDGGPLFDSVYTMASPMIDGYALVFQGGVPTIINRKGEAVYTLPAQYNAPEGDLGSYYRVSWPDYMLGWPSGGFIAAIENGPKMTDQLDYLRLSGKPGFHLSGYSAGGVLRDGYACVQNTEGLWGTVDSTGKVAIPCAYTELNYDGQGCYSAEKDGKWGSVDRKGNVVLPFEYSAVYGYGGGLFAVGKDGKFGLVDEDNQVVLPLEYDDITAFSQGVAYAVKDNLVYIITEAGKTEPKDLTRFTDDNGKGDWQWAAEAIYACYDAGLIKGYEDGRFAPADPLTRAQFVTMLYRLAGEPEVSTKNPFTDATADWYQDAIRWALQQEITTGTSETTFEPDLNVTREQMATFLYRYMRVADPEASIQGFADAADVDPWAVEAMAYCVKHGLMNGVGDYMLSPRTQASRAMAVATLYRYIRRIAS